MNNEEKILLVLEQLQQGQSQLSARIDTVQTSLTEKIDSVRVELTQKIDSVRADLTEKIEQTDSSLRIFIEAHTDKQIKLLAEGHISLSERLRPLEDLVDTVEDIQNTVSVLKYVFKEHREVDHDNGSY